MNEIKKLKMLSENIAQIEENTYDADINPNYQDPNKSANVDTPSKIMSRAFGNIYDIVGNKKDTIKAMKKHIAMWEQRM